MSAEQIIEEIKALTPGERAEVFKKTLPSICPQSSKAIERLLRRLENPDIPEDVWRGIEDAEDGRFVDMETALRQGLTTADQARLLTLQPGQQRFSRFVQIGKNVQPFRHGQGFE